jgi:hypothetical protein
LAVKVTGRVQIGRFVLEIGAPPGTRALDATHAAASEPAGNVVAMRG